MADILKKAFSDAKRGQQSRAEFLSGGFMNPMVLFVLVDAAAIPAVALYYAITRHKQYAESTSTAESDPAGQDNSLE
ncbi:MAG: hypothetical protein H6860_02435 [Rhodospirillales bacterium]|nr:hypothetical protein [Rhodospirillales bacterium]